MDIHVHIHHHTDPATTTALNRIADANERTADELARLAELNDGAVAERVNRLADKLNSQQDRLEGSVAQHTPTPAKP